MQDDTTITVIGLGAVGRSLTSALYHAGYAFKNLFSRNAERKFDLSKDLQPYFHVYHANIDEDLGDIIFICVSDNAIRDVAENLAARKGLAGKILVHCSGSFPAEILQTNQAYDIDFAAFHPIKSFSGKPEQDFFKGTYVDIQGTELAVNVLFNIAESLGAHAFQVTAESKPFLHAASVMASNYVVTLLDAASQIAEMGGIKRSAIQKALLPLLKGTIQNIEYSSDVEKALTGPVARADTKTIEHHLQILKQNPSVYNLYKKLGIETVEIAKRDLRISEDESKRLLEILDG